MLVDVVVGYAQDADGELSEDLGASLVVHALGRVIVDTTVELEDEALVLADEHRDGNVPAAMSNLPLIQRGFAALPTTITERFFRADTACYEEKILKWLAAPAREDGPQGTIGFSISADMSEGLRQVCAAVPEPSTCCRR